MVVIGARGYIKLLPSKNLPGLLYLPEPEPQDRSRMLCATLQIERSEYGDKFISVITNVKSRSLFLIFIVIALIIIIIKSSEKISIV